MPRVFDAIVIGTGQAGPALARRMASEGWKVAVLERKHPGGTCVNTGCIPTKALVESARAAAFARRAGELGVDVGDVRVDLRRVRERMRGFVERSRQGVARSLEKADNVTFVRGHGRFVAPDSVRVEGAVLRAKRIFVNVGARSRKPDGAVAPDVPWLDNSGLLALDVLPSHLVVVGGSYVGLELAQAYRRFGSRVTVIEKGPRLAPREDEDVSEALKAVMEKDGVSVRLGAECIAARTRGRDVVVGVRCDENGGEPEVIGSHLLFAIGRVPNTDDLGAAEAGLELDERGYVRVDDELRTSVPGVWALGDCNGRGAFTHTSYDDYQIVEANLLDGGRRRVGDRVPAYALYTDPPLGRCGMTEREARESGRPLLVGKYAMEHVTRARLRGETDGFLKVVVDARTKRVLGASLLGAECDEIVHALIDLMRADAPYTVVAEGMHIHPTISEYLPSVFQALEPVEAPGRGAGAGGGRERPAKAGGERRSLRGKKRATKRPGGRKKKTRVRAKRA